MKKNHILSNAILIIALMLSLSSSNLNSQQWPPLGPCYTLGNCTRTANSIELDYMGCTVVVVYQVIFCPPGQYQFQIDYITYSAGGNCSNLHLFLHPDGEYEPDAERYMQMKKDIYKRLFDNRWEFIRGNYICPLFAEFVYWWEGDCAMACEVILENGEHVFSTKSCQELACCGKRFVYCFAGDTQEDIVSEFTYWVGTACPPQIVPNFSLCPAPNDYFQGVRIVSVNATYCVSTCYED